MAATAPLKEYRRKRDFARTPEPSGSEAAPRPGRGLGYLIQKHEASHLHYDFRLELEGVLKSWAVPKGPSLDPSDRRLAMHVEDHPLAYGTFEGIIPAGQYGGGTVLLWDRGTWEPLSDPVAGYRQGKLHFRLHGDKLRGGWLLVRMKREAGEKESWLLRKESDEEARAGGAAIVGERPESVASGRTLEEIAQAADRTWQSNRAPEPPPEPKAHGKAKAKAKAKAKKTPSAPSPAASIAPAKLPGARPAQLPRKPPAPQLATLVARPPEGEDWLHELKFDGYRILAVLASGQATLWSRNGKDWTDRFPAVARAVEALPARAALLDGEVVVLLPDGTTSFQALQQAMGGVSAGELHYMAFDLLHLDGHDLRAVPLRARKEALRALLPDANVISYSQHVEESGSDVLKAACDLALEGIVSKRAGAGYASGRSRDWLKTKCTRRQELVIAGWTDSDKPGRPLRSLVLAVNQDGRLRYAGRVGTGFDDATLRDLARRLARSERRTPPLEPAPRLKGVHWVEPRLVAEIEFTEWTADGQLRHPSFAGLRADKEAAEVVREEPAAQPTARPLPAARAKGKSVAKAKSVARTKAKTKARTEAKPAAAARATVVPAAPTAPARGGAIEVGGVRITHPGRVLYPEQGLTKADLAAYYATVADRILPYLVDRPLTLVRCPEGREKDCFYQKHAGTSTPAALRRIEIAEKSGSGEYLAADDLAGLLATVQMGALELHVWNSRTGRIEQPDQFVLDLDPDPAVPWEQVVAAARKLRARLAELGLAAFVKTTGGKGLHVVTPLRPGREWPEVKAFTQALALERVREEPRAYVAVMSKAKRTGKIFIDYLRNERGATAIAPYSTRARPGAPVATPIAWEELADDVRGDHFNLLGMPARLAGLARDPWAGFDQERKALTVKMLRAVGVD